MGGAEVKAIDENPPKYEIRGCTAHKNSSRHDLNGTEKSVLRVAQSGEL
jgi:hypothetical protein